MFFVCAKVMYIPLYLFTFLCAIFQTSRASKIVQEPTDTEAIEHKECFFYCIARDLLDDQYLAWFRGDTQVSTNTRILVDIHRYIVDYDDDYGEYRLVIKSVSRQDGQSTYSCRIMQNSDTFLQSKEVRLQVNEVPNYLYPLCLPLRSKYNVGDTAIVSCKSELTVPQVSLSFTEDDKIIDQSLQLDYSETDYVSLRYTFEIEPCDNGKVFKCSMTSASMYEIRNCSMSPLNVHFIPNVTIQGPKHPYLDREEIFICYSSSNPPALSYTWGFMPPIESNRYETLNNILRIPNADEDLIGVVIICIVENIVGAGTQQFELLGKEEGSIDVDNLTTVLQFTTVGLSSRFTNLDDDNKWYNNSRHSIYMSVGAIVFFLIAAFIPLCVIKFYSSGKKYSHVRKNTSSDPYSEPKDQIPIQFPLSGQLASWKRSVGVQVKEGREGEPIYGEIPSHRYVYSTCDSTEL